VIKCDQQEKWGLSVIVISAEFLSERPTNLRRIFSKANKRNPRIKETAMESLEATALMAVLFLARIALPITLTVLFGYFMNYFVNRGLIEE
jgi:hypothetical protein